MKKFPEFIKIKNNYCIVYKGPIVEYAIQLLCILPYIESSLKGLNVYVSFRDFGLKHPKIITPANFVGHYYELPTNLEIHPIVELINSSNIKIGPAYITPQKSYANYCHIAKIASLPAKSLSDEQIDQLKEIIRNKGYIVSEKTDTAGWVIGPEGSDVFLAALKGIKTSIIPTGKKLGIELYKKLFPDGEIINL